MPIIITNMRMKKMQKRNDNLKYYRTILVYMGKKLNVDYFCVPGKITERDNYLIKLDKCIDSFDNYVPKYKDFSVFQKAFNDFVEVCRLEVQEISPREYQKMMERKDEKILY